MQISSSGLRSSAHSSYNFIERESIRVEQVRPNTAVNGPLPDTETDEISLDSKTRKLIRALEALTGQKIDLNHFRATYDSNHSTPYRSDSSIITYERIQAENSRLNLSFEGQLRTKEGKEITFSLSIQWKQEFVETERIRLQNGAEMEDPLIISLDGKPPVFPEKFDFNLTATAPQLNNLTAGSGYLVNDLNANGRADNGLELFGPKTSDGFAELAAYDDDGNGWIDSADTVFKQLYLWSPQKGDGDMVSLEQVGIGAISLSPRNIDYLQKSSIDTPLARFKEASVALSETGEAYGVFSIDLAV